MKKQEILLAEMQEGKSKYGNTYFYSTGNLALRYMLRNERQKNGNKIWRLYLL